MLGTHWTYMFIYVILVVVLGVLLLCDCQPVFLPDEDQGRIVCFCCLCLKVRRWERNFGYWIKFEKYFLEDEKDNVQAMFSVVGFSFQAAVKTTVWAFLD